MDKEWNRQERLKIESNESLQFSVSLKRRSFVYAKAAFILVSVESGARYGHLTGVRSIKLRGPTRNRVRANDANLNRTTGFPLFGREGIS